MISHIFSDAIMPYLYEVLKAKNEYLCMVATRIVLSQKVNSIQLEKLLDVRNLNVLYSCSHRVLENYRAPFIGRLLTAIFVGNNLTNRFE